MITVRQMRKILQENGYRLIKSRKRKWTIDDQCGYMIVRDDYNAVAAGGQYDLSLEDVQAFCRIYKPA